MFDLLSTYILVNTLTHRKETVNKSLKETIHLL